MIEHKQLCLPLGILTAVSAVVAVTSGCATTQRQEPPAPIVDARRPPPAPVTAAPVEPTPPPEPARVYAYQPMTETAPAGTAPNVAATPQAGAAAQGTQASPTGPAGQPQAPAGAQAATPPPSSQTPAPDGGQNTPALPAPETRVASSSALQAPQLTPAVDALVTQAERQRQSSDYAGAAATLERALRLQSREGYLWNRLAHVRLEQGLASQAANLAKRANDLSGDSENLKRDNWLVIADARRRTGDLQGAQEAQRKASGG